MKADIYNLEGEKVRSIELPKQFNEEYRPDLIKRAVHAIMSHNIQKYGANSEAGKRSSAKLSRRRRDYKGAYGIGISRIPRKTMWRRGTQFGWVGAWAPGTVGGRRAHPPKAERNWEKSINVKERKKAIRSAIAGLLRMNKIKILDSKLEDIKKIKDLGNILTKNKLELDIKKKVRAGRGSNRGRKYKKSKGILFIVSKKCELMNVNVDVVNVKDINALVLTRGQDEPRQCVWSEEALKRLNEGLFY